jgi:hypothetical protein
VGLRQDFLELQNVTNFCALRASCARKPWTTCFHDTPERGAARQGFAAGQGVVVISAGTWGKAIKVPGSGALNTGGFALVSSVSCASAGNCVADGFYTGRSRRRQAFVVSERNGRWGNTIEVPGSGALNTAGFAEVNSVSCGSAGNCVAGGSYADGSNHFQAFVVSRA